MQQWLSWQRPDWSVEKQDVHQISSGPFANDTRTKRWTSVCTCAAFQFCKISQMLLRGETRLAPGAVPRTKSKPQPIHHICQSRLFVLRKTTSLESSCNLYPQIAEYMVRAFGKPLCYNYRHFNTQCFIKYVHNPQTNAIFMYRLRWVFVPWSSPYKAKLAGNKSDFMSWNCSLCLRQSL